MVSRLTVLGDVGLSQKLLAFRASIHGDRREGRTTANKAKSAGGRRLWAKDGAFVDTDAKYYLVEKCKNTLVMRLVNHQLEAPQPSFSIARTRRAYHQGPSLSARHPPVKCVHNLAISFNWRNHHG